MDDLNNPPKTPTTIINIPPCNKILRYRYLFKAKCLRYPTQQYLNQNRYKKH